jgi:CRP-like cAMP-binding protein
MHSTTFHPGEIIFHEGDESREAYWILSGKVEISIDTPQGRSVLTTLEEGEIFGEMGMIDDLPRAASARALTETEVDVVNERDFHLEILRDEGRLMPYLDMLFERLRGTNAMLRAEVAKNSAAAPAPSTIAPTATSDSPAEHPSKVVLTSTDRSATFHPHGLSVELEKFPFRIGRHPDHEGLSGFGRVDLELADHRPYSVSRGHCLIERKGQSYFVRDCGSRLGTIVNGALLGAGASEITAPLNPGENRLVLGSEDSPHEYLITVS